MKIFILSALTGLTLLLTYSCKKHNDPAPDSGKDTTQAKPTHCVLIGENIKSVNTSYFGNWKYEYDSSGVPKTLTKFDTLGAVVGEVDITAKEIVDWRGFSTFISDYQGDLFSGLPASEDQSLNYKGTITPHIAKYTFSYDSKGRLASFVDIYSTTYTIAYDDSDNVTKLSYTANGGNGYVAVTAYDNHPSPYYTSGKKIWKFIQHNFSWGGEDNGSLIAAISRNNPQKLTIYGINTQTNKSSQVKEIDTYTYNDTGYPIEKVSTHVRQDGDSYFFSRYTYSYDCK